MTTRMEGIDELIEDGVSGILVEPRDARNLAAKLQLLLNDAALRARLATEGRKVIEAHFDRRRNFSDLKALLLAPRAEPVLNSLPATETLQPAL